MLLSKGQGGPDQTVVVRRKNQTGRFVLHSASHYLLFTLQMTVNGVLRKQNVFSDTSQLLNRCILKLQMLYDATGK